MLLITNGSSATAQNIRTNKPGCKTNHSEPRAKDNFGRNLFFTDDFV